jgi:hypothetical protein
MLTIKQQILDVVNSLPDDCTMEDIRYNLYLRRKVEDGIRAAEAGEVFTTEQAIDEVRKWRRLSGQNPPSTT